MGELRLYETFIRPAKTLVHALAELDFERDSTFEMSFLIIKLNRP